MNQTPYLCPLCRYPTAQARLRPDAQHHADVWCPYCDRSIRWTPKLRDETQRPTAGQLDGLRAAMDNAVPHIHRLDRPTRNRLRWSCRLAGLGVLSSQEVAALVEACSWWMRRPLDQKPQWQGMIEGAEQLEQGDIP